MCIELTNSGKLCKIPSNDLFCHVHKLIYNEWVETHSLSRVEEKWLDYMEQRHGITILRQYPTSDIGIVDGYCCENNTVYSYHGDYWYGNPYVYNPDKDNGKDTTFEEVFRETVKRDNTILAAGYELQVQWETDIHHYLNILENS